MQHTRKLVLTEPQFVKPTIRDSALSKLDTDIRDILYSEEDDYSKAKRYASVLRRYRAFDEEPVPRVSNIQTLEENVLKSTPANLQYKAKRVLTQLGKDKDVDFTEDGKLVYKQTPVGESNILDIISDILQKKPSFAKGGKEIAASLKSTKTPEELISNPIILKHMQEEVKKDESKPRRSKRGKKVAWEEY